MSREDNIWFLLTVVAGVTLGVVLGLWYAEVHPDQALIYDFQAIIAGFMALIAGIMTVVQMARVDLQQAERQRELMSVQLRKDALTLDRFRFEISAMAEGSRRQVDRLHKFNSQDALDTKGYEIGQVIIDFYKLPRIEKFKNYVKAEGLLSAEFHQKASELKRIHDRAYNLLWEANTQGTKDGLERLSAFSAALSEADAYCDCYAEVFDQISDLWRKYIRATGLPLKDVTFRIGTNRNHN